MSPDIFHVTYSLNTMQMSGDNMSCDTTTSDIAKMTSDHGERQGGILPKFWNRSCCEVRGENEMCEGCGGDG